MKIKPIQKQFGNNKFIFHFILLLFIVCMTVQQNQTQK